MKNAINIPRIKGVEIHKIDDVGDCIVLHVILPIKPHRCPARGEMTHKNHVYRIQKIKHLKWFERLSVLFYKR